jgi:hypothetical protein
VWIVLACAVAVALTAAADALSRTGHSGGSILFWAASALIIGPAGVRLAGTRASVPERAATVVVVGLALYAIKILQNPWQFTYADELLHVHNLQAILSSGRLFQGNSLLPITTRYPGLESVAAAITRAGGISPFAAGCVLIGVARALIMLALYLLYERVSGSARVAGLGALAYTATPTYLFFSAQFSYESLALPLAGVATYAIVSWGQSPSKEARQRWALVILPVAAAVIVTHHVSTYAFVVFLVGLCLAHTLLSDRRGAPWLISGTVGALMLGWLVFVGTGTVQYLSPVLSNAVDKVLQTLHGDAATRVLFANQTGAEQTPLSEQYVAIAGILLLCLTIAAGLYRIWRHGRDRPVPMLLAISALLYVATLPLRFIPAAWETASRAGEFLFIGVGLVVGLGLTWLLERPYGRDGGRRIRRWLGRALAGPRRRRVAVGVTLALVFASGVIAGWPASLRMGLPLRVTVGGRTVMPSGYVAVNWSQAMLGTDQRVVAEDADARLFLDDAHQTAFTADGKPDWDTFLSTTAPLGLPQRALLKSYRVTLVESDRRDISTDIIAGYFFNLKPPALRRAASVNKFNLPSTNRLFDGGDQVIFGVRGLW